jgi:hypothetical protein
MDRHRAAITKHAENGVYMPFFGIIQGVEDWCPRDVCGVRGRGRTTLEVAGMITLRVPLTLGKFALIDEVDAPKVVQYRWRAIRSSDGQTYYAAACFKDGSGKYRNIYMHRLIMDCPLGMEVDHKERDGLDNRRSNLRVVTTTQNAYNRRIQRDAKTGFIGVTARQRLGTVKYEATIRRGNEGRDGKTYIGMFDTAEEAAIARDKFARELRGEFAKLNFPHMDDANA